MLRGLLRLIIVVVIVVAIGAFFVGYRWGRPEVVRVDDRPVGTSGAVHDIDTSKARETGAAIGETVAASANQAQRALSAAGLTAKIKSKMALDDSIVAANIDVDTDGSVVTLTGRVDTGAQKDRALRLARETEGVTSVVDRLRVDGQ
jgi:hyperosmotically inducible periplasmic protein